MSEVCKISDGDFFTQTLFVDEYNGHSWEYCKDLCIDKKVLHIGCSDFPFDNSKGTLHGYLSPIANELHGCDINGIEEMKKHYPGIYFNSIDEVNEQYDVILVPNIIEHLNNPGLFIGKLFDISFNSMFVLVPNCSVIEQSKYDKGVFTEKIHPDHYAWYSPYTLYNLFKPYIQNTESKLIFFDNRNMIGLQIN